MTGDTTVFATVDDVATRWRTLSESETTRCTALLADASDLIRTSCPNWQTASETSLRRVTCAAVIRALQSGDMMGVSQTSQTTGPFSEQVTYANPGGDLYLTRAEKKTLGGVQRVAQFDMAGA